MTSSGGDVMVFLSNKSATQPKFSYSVDLLSNAGYNYRGPVAIGFADFTGDGVGDLLVGGPSSNRCASTPGCSAAACRRPRSRSRTARARPARGAPP
jgi:hypothetical protein